MEIRLASSAAMTSNARSPIAMTVNGPSSASDVAITAMAASPLTTVIAARAANHDRKSRDSRFSLTIKKNMANLNARRSCPIPKITRSRLIASRYNPIRSRSSPGLHPSIADCVT